MRQLWKAPASWDYEAAASRLPVIRPITGGKVKYGKEYRIQDTIISDRPRFSCLSDIVEKIIDIVVG